MDIHAYWEAVLRQDADAMRRFLSPDAVIRWHNTNEQFTAEEFIRANCEYPGEWRGEAERIEQIGETVICVMRVCSADGAPSFHVTSFIQTAGASITAIDEYWGDDGEAPAWRQQMHLGRPIRSR